MKAHKCPQCSSIFSENSDENLCKCSICGNLGAEECVYGMLTLDKIHEFGTIYLCPKCKNDSRELQENFGSLADMIKKFINEYMRTFDFVNPITGIFHIPGTDTNRPILCAVCGKPAWAVKYKIRFCQKHAELIPDNMENENEIAKIQP